IDNAGNQESTKQVTVRIAKAPPEAFVQFDPASKTVQLFSKDSSGVVTGPLTPTTVTPVVKVYGKGNDTGSDKGKGPKTELRVYNLGVTGNSLQLTLQVTTDANARHIQATITSLVYVGVINATTKPVNSMDFTYDVKKDGTLTTLH